MGVGLALLPDGQVEMVLLWWGVLVALALLGAPLAASEYLFADFPGRGAGLALPTSLTVVALVAFWVGHVPFGWPVLALVLGLGVLALAVAAVGRGGPGPDLDYAALAEALAVFTVAFAFLVAVRAVALGVHPYNEHFTDYGLLRALLRSSALPPEDMWFAGEPVRYYYGGHLITALLTELTGVDPRYAYNLAMATFYGMLAAAAYELSGALGATRGAPRRLAGLLGVFFVAVAGNLYTALRAVLWLVPDPLAAPVVAALAGDLGSPAAEWLDRPPWAFDPQVANTAIPGTDSVFPMNAWLGHSHLHSYMMGAPFLLLAVGLVFSYYRTPETAVWRRRTTVFVALPAVAGLLAVTITWFFPVVVGLTALGLAFAPADPATLLPGRVAVGDVLGGREGSGLLDRSPFRPNGGVDRLRSLVRRFAGDAGSPAVEVATLAVAGVLAAASGAAGALLAAPFLASTATGRSLATLAPTQRTPLLAFLVVHGAFFLVFAAYLLDVNRARERWRRAAVVGAIAVGALVFLVPRSLEAAVLVLPFLLGAWYCLHTGVARGFEVVLVLAGAGLVLLVEFLYVEELAHMSGSKWNTVFKVYMAVWLLWGVAAAGVVASRVGGRSRPSRRTWTVLAVTVVLVTSLYAPLAVGTHFGTDRTATIDGMRFLEYHPDEAEAIYWLDERKGTPTMVSAPATEMYRWNASQAASLTGMPTVVGWRHQASFRGNATYYDRVRDVDALYGTADDRERVDLLAAYDVTYVYVGPAERERYDEIRPFDGLRGVTVAFENERVTVYRVDHDELGPGEDRASPDDRRDLRDRSDRRASHRGTPGRITLPGPPGRPPPDRPVRST